MTGDSGDWLGLLNSIMRDVNDFAATGDYRLAGALTVLSREAKQAAVTVEAARPRRGKVSELAPVS